jgi:Nickel responsive protein SCO4226-like
VPRYVIWRTFEVSEAQMPEVNRRSKRLARDQFPGIVWEHSHVAIDEHGEVRTFCVYEAPSEEVVRQHAEALGEHSVDGIFEIAGDVTPADFPLEEEQA